MTTTAIIVAFQSERTIRQCISSARAAGIDEIVVWDNGADEQLEELTRGTSNVTVLGDGTNYGFGGAVNRAVDSVSAGDELILLNPDCFLTGPVLAELRRLIAIPTSGAVEPRMRYPDGRAGISGGPAPTLAKELAAMTKLDDLAPAWVRQRALRLSWGRRHGEGTYADSLEVGVPIRVDWVSGFCMMLRLEVFRKLGGFDERFFLYFEDVDLCVRLRAMGYEVLLARDVEALHIESASTSQVGKNRHYREGLRTYLGKHGTPMQRAIVRLGLPR